MKKTRRELSTAERAELWRRWKADEAVSDIARASERQPRSVYVMISAADATAFHSSVKLRFVRRFFFASAAMLRIVFASWNVSTRTDQLHTPAKTRIKERRELGARTMKLEESKQRPAACLS